MRKCYIDYRPIKSMGCKKDKLPYGVGRLAIGDVSVIQKIYGAIQEFIGFDSEKWVI
jgi:hypothetical protein